MTRYDDLPYRTCVGMMLLNPKGLVFIGRQLDAGRLTTRFDACLAA